MEIDKALRQLCGEGVVRCDSSDGQNCIVYLQITSTHEPAVKFERLHSLPKLRIKELVTLQFTLEATNIQMVHVRKASHSRKLNREDHFSGFIFAAFTVNRLGNDRCGGVMDRIRRMMCRYGRIGCCWCERCEIVCF
jgi:hypothetical protein